MSLFRQLLSLFVGSLLVMTLLMAFAQLSSQRQFIMQQQQLQLFSSLNSIALSVKPLIQLGDQARLDATLTAYFDSGQFQSLQITAPDGSSIWQQQSGANQAKVPLWFQQLPLFEAITVTQQIELQWRPLANFSLTGDPGLAYQNLWQSMLNVVAVMLAVMLLCAGLLALQLRRLTKPLATICAQSNAISQHRPLPPSEQGASTTEFAQVQQAFTIVAEHFNKLFNEQAEEAQRLKHDLYTDPLTGIGNRELIEAQIDQWCHQGTPGALALLTVPLLTEISNDPEQYQLTVQQLQQQMQDLLPQNTASTLARLTTTELILLVTELNQDELEPVSQRLSQLLNEIGVDPLGLSQGNATVAMLYSQKPSHRSDMFTRVDKLLLEAQEHPAGQAHVQLHQQQQATLGRKQWLKQVEQAIQKRTIEFNRQACITLDGELQHYELFCKLNHGGQFFAANAFLPALESLGQTCAFDRYVIEQAIEKIEQEDLQPLAINLCVSSLADSGFMRWLQRTMKSHQHLQGKMIFEISEAALYRQRDQAVLACDIIDSAGFGFGIDNFGRYLTDIQYLAELPPPRYVKLDMLYSQEIDNENQRGLLISLCRTAHNFNLKTIATNIQDSEQLSLFTHLHVDGVQGLVSQTWQEVQTL
ncbi:EAL domain-containing protein [uncultured Ferrimonas sp.]|uniref:bifunctional diguanylate cyclase/phosphodiesterase n=1 Tax=uncultured Ferrimonas sp. TaxID=432640 RepID=UPI002601D371|nr:EAL domain-containing protein [uncultured Ferrimonas sp.]